MSNTLNLLERQITNEFYNSMLYLAMASAFEIMNLDGFAKVYRDHSVEERGHGTKLLDHLLDRAYPAQVVTIEAAPSMYGKTPTEMAELTLQAEKKTTAAMHAIAEAATADRDHTTYSFIQWFVDEQVSEEDEAAKLLGKLRMNESVFVPLLDQEWLED